MAKSNKSPTMTYARLFALLGTEANGLPVGVADGMEAMIMAGCADNQLLHEFWTRTVPLWRAVQQLAEARINRTAAQERVDRITALLQSAGETRTMEDVEAVRQKITAVLI